MSANNMPGLTLAGEISCTGTAAIPFYEMAEETAQSWNAKAEQYRREPTTAEPV